MHRLVTAEQMRALEAAAETQSMPASLLMENAGEALAQAALKLAGPEGRFVVVCGRGNNGGDGLVAARKLFAAERSVSVEIIGGASGLKGDPLRNLQALTALGIVPGDCSTLVLSRGDVVIDAIFGTGLSRAPEGAFADAIRRIEIWRSQGARVVAADLPSGLDGNTGKPFAPCVEADFTVTFGLHKIGLALEPGASLSGIVSCAQIGLPNADARPLPGDEVHLLEDDDVRQRLPKRQRDSNKGTYGHVLVVAGSHGKTGAAALAAMGALRSGAGLVTIATRPDALAAAQAFSPELMGTPLEGTGPLSPANRDALLRAAERKDALVIGPGIPRGEQTGALILELLERLEIPCVLDADALNAVADRFDALKATRARKVLTPHPGEAARLLGTTTREVQDDRLKSARRLAERSGSVAILKGAKTVIASPEGQVWINPTGNPGMSTAGTGDVLSGVCGGLLAQGRTPNDAAICAVFAHGRAGDLIAARRGEMGLIASDLFEGLGLVWRGWGL